MFPYNYISIDERVCVAVAFGLDVSNTPNQHIVYAIRIVDTKSHIDNSFRTSEMRPLSNQLLPNKTTTPPKKWTVSLKTRICSVEYMYVLYVLKLNGNLEQQQQKTHTYCTPFERAPVFIILPRFIGSVLIVTNRCVCEFNTPLTWIHQSINVYTQKNTHTHPTTHQCPPTNVSLKNNNNKQTTVNIFTDKTHFIRTTTCREHLHIVVFKHRNLAYLLIRLLNRIYTQHIHTHIHTQIQNRA